MTTQAPLSWVKRIEEDVSICKSIPLWGSAPSFPLQKISEHIAKEFNIEDVQIVSTHSDLLRAEELLFPFGDNPKLFFFKLAPLAGYMTLALSAESVEKIAFLALTNTATKGLSDSEFLEGFFQYFLLEAASLVEKAGVYPDLHIEQTEKKELPKKPCLALDLSIKLAGRIFLARLIVTPELHAAFSSHPFKHTPPSSSKGLVDVDLSLEAGSCSLKRPEWGALKQGDLLVLDRCSYDPEAGSGTAVLVFAEKPCFIVKIKKTGIKILDYAVYQGDNMSTEFTPDSFDEETPIPKPTAGESDEEEAVSAEEVKVAVSSPPEALTSPESIPFPVSVEIDRIRMPLEKLLGLVPGNVIEMSVRPEQGVYLTVHGKKIARGELVKIGEVLGVKILEIGSP